LNQKKPTIIESQRMKGRDDENKMAFEKKSRHDSTIHFDIP
jgi:hypothetical protein